MRRRTQGSRSVRAGSPHTKNYREDHPPARPVHLSHMLLVEGNFGVSATGLPS